MAAARHGSGGDEQCGADRYDFWAWSVSSHAEPQFHLNQLQWVIAGGAGFGIGIGIGDDVGVGDDVSGGDGDGVGVDGGGGIEVSMFSAQYVFIAGRSARTM